MLYLVLAVFSLHVLVIPTVITVKADIDSERQYGKIIVKLFFIPVFIKNIDFEKINDALNGIPPTDEEADEEPEPDKKKRGSKFKRAVKAFLIQVGLRIAKRVRVREIQLQSKIGAGDAAATAVAVSSALVFYCQACAFFGVKPSHGAIMPDYDGARLFVKFYGIISLCIADIIYAVLSQILSKFARRGKGEVYGKRAVAD